MGDSLAAREGGEDADAMLAARIYEEQEAAFVAGRLPPHVQIHEWLSRLAKAQQQGRPNV